MLCATSLIISYTRLNLHPDRPEVHVHIHDECGQTDDQEDQAQGEQYGGGYAV